MNRPGCRPAPAKKFQFGGVLLAAVALTAPFAYAGVNRWTTSGPAGAYVTSLAIDPVNPETVYAGTQREVFKSGDGGVSWKVSLEGSSFGPFAGLAIDPHSSSNVYAVTRNLGVFRSFDAGGNWGGAGAPASYAPA